MIRKHCFTSLALLLIVACQPGRISSRTDEAVALLKMEGLENAYPYWSNDGTKILFQSNRTGKWQIYIMNSDGSNQHAVTNDDYNNNYPCWSPDNNKITFVSDRDGNEEIYVMNADGSGMLRLTNNSARDIHPYWSPDGSVILFNSTRFEDNFEIFEIHPDGTDLKRLTFTPDHETCARVSPNGDKILFLKGIQGYGDEIFVMDRDGSNPVNLTNDIFPDGWPSWTDDGNRILFSSYRPGTFCIFSMNAEGKDLRRISYSEPPYNDARANVLNNKIVFNRQIGSTLGIYTLDLDNWDELEAIDQSILRFPVEGKTLESYTGTYRFRNEKNDIPLYILSDDGKLFIQFENKVRYELTANSEFVFSLQLTPLTIVFVEDKNGEVRSLNFIQNARSTEFVKIVSESE